MGLGFYRGRDSKYNATPTRCAQGILHHSGAESRRCNELHLLQAGGLIRDLDAHPQPRFKLDVNGVHVADYLADFSYTRTDGGQRIVEDVKGHSTETYKLKRRLMLACHGIEIEEVRK